MSYSLFDDPYSDKIFSLLEAKSNGDHRTLSGKLVKLGSKDCAKDIQKRMDDIRHHRDSSNLGTDERVYYSGVLRVLRRKLRENDKVMTTAKDSKTKNPKKSKKLSESFDIVSDDKSQRMLLLAGLI